MRFIAYKTVTHSVILENEYQIKFLDSISISINNYIKANDDRPFLASDDSPFFQLQKVTLDIHLSIHQFINIYRRIVVVF